MSPMIPAPASECPILDLTADKATARPPPVLWEGESRDPAAPHGGGGAPCDDDLYSFPLSRSTAAIAPTSIGSPSGVPVPWSSMEDREDGSLDEGCEEECGSISDREDLGNDRCHSN